jgi:glycosyltransferase involved in cell wall biosynthesis
LDATPAPPATPGVRTIAYVGSFYYDPATRAAALLPAWRRAPHRWLFYTPRREDWLYRSPWFFLRGLARFTARYPRLAPRLRVEFAGAVPPWLPPMLAETGTTAQVTLHGPIAHADAIRLQRRADALLLTSAKVDGARDYSIAGKTFEYLGLRRPILAVVTDGAMRDLVEQSGLGLFADPDDADSVAAAIARIVDDPSWLPHPNEAFIASCDRHHAASRMADVLRAAAAEGYRG